MIELKEKDGLYDIKATRIEVVDEEGRVYVRYIGHTKKMRIAIQDEERTIKIFIDDK